MQLIALKNFQVRTNGDLIMIKKGATVIVPDVKAGLLVERGLAEPAIPTTVSLTPALERRLSVWDCESCSWFMGDGETVCIVEGKQVTHVVAIARLKTCPKRNRKILRAILRNHHLAWLN